MNFYPRRRRTPQVIIVSLIDIFAILLIFVIVTTTFNVAQPEVTIKLPESRTAVAAEQRKQAVILSIAENEDIFLAAQKLTLAELKPAIQNLMRESPAPTLALSADKKAPFGMVIQVLDVLKEAGVKGNLSAFTESAK